jgi:hypothetical protein
MNLICCASARSRELLVSRNVQPMSGHGEAKMPIIVRSIFFAIGLLFAAVTGIGQSSHPSHQANSDGMSPYPYPGDFVFSWYA